MTKIGSSFAINHAPSGHTKMLFYFLVHTFLGLIFGSAQELNKTCSRNPGAVPKWVWSYGKLIENISFACCILAVITTLINFTLGWAVLTLLEVMLGIFIAKLLSTEVRAFFAVTSVLSVPYVMGGLWKFWWI